MDAAATTTAVVRLWQTNRRPEFISVAPGRVNLIGEHIDHQGYAVLPMALDRSIQIAGYSDSRRALLETNGEAPGSSFLSTVPGVKSSWTAPVLVLSSDRPEKFETVSFEHLSDIKVNSSHTWANYVIAALLGVLEFSLCDGNAELVGSLVQKSTEPLPTAVAAEAKRLLGERSLMLRVSGQVPLASGVSSSSALLVAAAVIFSRFFDVRMSREAMAVACAKAERHIGVSGGGMDQAAVCLCRPGTARLIDFEPLRTTPVGLPKGGTFVLCHSCKEAPKAVDAPICYNKRVFELRLAAFLTLKSTQQEPLPSEVPQLTLRKAQEKLGWTLQQMGDALREQRRQATTAVMTKVALTSELGEERIGALLANKAAAEVWERNEEFEPFRWGVLKGRELKDSCDRRACHVLDEAQRVLEVANICRSSDLPEHLKLSEIGRLMDASQTSLEQLYECCCPQLTEVIAAARVRGALGARLTGAGWGGYALALVPDEAVDSFVTQMKAFYTENGGVIHVPRELPLDDVVFSVVPVGGATIVGPDGNFIDWR